MKVLQIIMITPQIIYQKETMIYSKGIEFWAESFGNSENPPIILIMGAGMQGILWPTEFCKILAGRGFFVIRYDHRDTGFSSSIDYDASPYNLLDMASDVVQIQNHYHLQNAHIVGFSMGGVVAMILAAHYPERVRSLTLIATSIDYRPAFDAMQGNASNHSLPIPLPRAIAAIKKFQAMSSLSLDGKIQVYIDTAKSNSGSLPVDEALCREIAILNFERMKNSESPRNHYRAIMASHDIHAAAPSKITAHTHIVHGDEDPIFPLEHGMATHAAISKSTISIVPGLGHHLSNKDMMSAIVNNIITTVKVADE